MHKLQASVELQRSGPYQDAFVSVEGDKDDSDESDEDASRKLGKHAIKDSNSVG